MKLALLATLFMVATAHASAYYVSPSGKDTNPGTAAAPLKTLQQGVSLLSAGDTLNAEPGTYTAGFTMGWDAGGKFGLRSGKAASPITIQADPAASAGSVIITGPATLDSSGTLAAHVIYTDTANGQGQCDYIVIQGFTINCGSKVSQDGIHIGQSSGVQILNCTVTNAGRFGINTSHTTDCVIQGNSVSGSKGSDTSGHGIYVANNAVRPVVRNNTLFNNGSEGLHMNGDKSQGGGGMISAAVVSGNVIYGNAANGINCDGLTNSTVTNNLIYGNGRHGIVTYHADSTSGSTGNTLSGNTIYQPNSSGAAIQLVTGSTGTKISNNILIGGTYGAINISNDSKAGLSSDYNAVVDRFQNDDSGTRYTLAQWRLAFGQDAHSFAATNTQLFVSATDFHLKAGSLASGTGTPSGVNIGYNYPGSATQPSTPPATQPVPPTADPQIAALQAALSAAQAQLAASQADATAKAQLIAQLQAKIAAARAALN